MNGIFSSTPGSGPMRILIGTHGLMLAQASLALMTPGMAQDFRFMVGFVMTLALIGLGAAVLGLPAEQTEPYWRRRHVR